MKHRAAARGRLIVANNNYSKNSLNFYPTVFYRRDDPAASEAASIAGAGQRKSRNSRDRLVQASNFASALCVLDCTVLPLLTIGLSIIAGLSSSPMHSHHHHHAAAATAAASGLGGTAAQQLLGMLHEWGHAAALYFVVPIGTLAAIVNYVAVHRSKRIVGLAGLGVLLVLAANSGGVGGLCGSATGAAASNSGLGHTLHHVLHLVHHGWLHRVTNLAGCALLLTSNHLSKQRQASCANPDCRC
jgi:hypothetical protein